MRSETGEGRESKALVGAAACESWTSLADSWELRAETVNKMR